MAENADGRPWTPGTELEEQARINVNALLASAPNEHARYTTVVPDPPEGSGIEQAAVARRAGEILEAEHGYVCGLLATSTDPGGAATWLIVARNNEDMLEYIARTPGAMERISAVQ